ncbi:MAG TPA: hypothetical protein ENK20_09695 [Chromatiales bacterium]|nr:hypothetical protein [Chromatiales bacterium]
MTEPTWPTPATRPDAFERLPGLYRRWEMQQVLDARHDFHIEEAGTATDGTQLFAVYRRRHNHEEASNE